MKLKKTNPQFYRRHKYNAQRVTLGERSFASKGEAALYHALILRERAGEIKVLQCQDHIYLTDARILYIPDFKLEDQITKEVFWAEFKGFETSDWAIKLRLWRFYGPGRLEVWKGSHLRLCLHETVIPKTLK